MNPNPIAMNVVSNVGTAQLTLVLPVGTHTITAQFLGNTPGNPLYNPLTSAPLTVPVNKANTTSTVTVSPPT